MSARKNFQCVRCRYQSLTILTDCELHMDKSITNCGMSCYDNSFIHLNGTTVFTGDCEALFLADMYSAIYFVQKAVINSTQATGSKYRVINHSDLILCGRGEDILGDTLTAGTTDESSKVY